MKINPEDFRPKVKGESDFFSWKLYRWLINHKDYTTVYKKDGDHSYLWIGRKYPEDGGNFSGVRLTSVCCHGNSPTIGSYAFNDGNEWEDINEEFWAEYRRIGVCAIHTNLVHKWNYIYPTKRKCEYCGKIESSYIETKRVERWK